MNEDDALEVPLAVLEVTETFAGPKEEIDKLAAINWNLISSTDGSGTYNHFVQLTREGENSLRVDVQHHYPI